MFNSEGLRGIGLDPATLYPVVAPRPPPLPLDSGKIAKAPSQAIPVRIHARLTKKKRHPELYAGLHEAAAVPYLGSEEDEELRDALSPIYDQLQLKPIWWLLEIIPLNLRYQRGDNEWVSTFGYVCLASGCTSNILASFQFQPRTPSIYPKTEGAWGQSSSQCENEDGSRIRRRTFERKKIFPSSKTRCWTNLDRLMQLFGTQLRGMFAVWCYFSLLYLSWVNSNGFQDSYTPA